MTVRVAGAIATGAFAVGLLAGSAAAVVAREPTTIWTDMQSVMVEHMNDHGMGSMMSMTSMMSGSMMGPTASSMPMDPDDHACHHMAPASPEVSK